MAAPRFYVEVETEALDKALAERQGEHAHRNKMRDPELSRLFSEGHEVCLVSRASMPEGWQAAGRADASPAPAGASNPL